MTVTERMKLADSRIGRSTSSLTVNINQPVKSEAETARAVTNAAKDVGFEY